AHHAGFAVHDGDGAFLGFLDLRQDAPRVAQQGFAAGRQAHAAPHAREQRHIAQIAVQVAHAPGEGRLSKVQPLRRALEELLLGSDDEIRQMADYADNLRPSHLLASAFGTGTGICSSVCAMDLPNASNLMNVEPPPAKASLNTKLSAW